MAAKKKFNTISKLFKISITCFEEAISSFSEISSIKILEAIQIEVNTEFERLKEAFCSIDPDEEDIELMKVLDTSRCKLLLKCGELESKLDNRLKPVASPTSMLPSDTQIFSNCNDIDVPAFNGEPTQWPKFRDMFKAMVIDNNNIPNVRKLVQLNKCLIGEARKVIDNVEISNDNFEVAWKLIVKRYESPRTIVREHVTKILSPPALQPVTSGSLRQFIDHFASHVNALLALKDGVKLQDLLLVALVSKYLPSELLIGWELYLGDTKSPNYEELMAFLIQQQRALSFGEGANVNVSLSSNVQIAPVKMSCYICNGSHQFSRCSNFLSWNPTQRSEWVSKRGFCIRCLRKRSFSHACSVTCEICSKAHHRLLHFTKSMPKVSYPVQTRSSNNFKSVHPMKSTILLPTAVVNCFTAKGKSFAANVLLDSGSEVCLITEEAARRLSWPRNKVKILITSVSEDQRVSTESMNVLIRSRNGNWKKMITFIIVPFLSRVVKESFSNHDWGIPNDISLADDQFNKSKPLHMLLGADVMFEVMLQSKFCPQNVNVFPFLKETCFGWVVAGRIPTSNHINVRHSCNYLSSNFDLSAQIKKFWENEHVTSGDVRIDEEDFCVNHFKKYVARDSTGRYSVRLPVIPNSLTLGQSRWLAKRRLLSLERVII